MTRFVASPARWLGRHAIPAVAVTLIAGAAAGGGIAYAMTSSSSPSSTPAGRPQAPGKDAGVRVPGAPLARQVVALVVKDTGLTMATIRADLATGESLDQIAGAKATTLENDIVTALTTASAKRFAALGLPARAASGLHASQSARESRIRTRVHELMAEPGTQLLQLLRPRGLVDGLAPPRPAHPRTHVTRPATSPSPSPAA